MQKFISRVGCVPNYHVRKIKYVGTFIFLLFLLATTTLFLLPSSPSTALGSEIQKESAETMSGDVEPENPGELDPQQPVTPTIADVVVLDETDTWRAYATNNENPSIVHTITKKGESYQLYSLVSWTDGPDEPGGQYVTWWMDSGYESIASLSPSGLLTPHGDGTVPIHATVDGSYTYSGQDLTCTVYVDIQGQTDQRYVTGIQITDENGAVIGTETYMLEGPIETAQAQFYANVDVYDPATNETITYSTKNGLLSEQTDDIGNLVWSLADASLGYIDPDYGMFRPEYYGGNQIRVKSNAGFGGSELSDSIAVRYENPEEEVDGYFPQDTLTIKAVYETQIEEEFGSVSAPNLKAQIAHFDEDDFVINKTYTVSDIYEKFEIIYRTYTAVAGSQSGGFSYYTLTGEGPRVADVLRDAFNGTDVNPDNAIMLTFETYDNLPRVIHTGYLLGTTRYYMPHIDIGNTSEAQVVEPMFALESNQTKDGSTAPNPEMDEGTRFRLLLGQNGDLSDSSSKYLIKWINTVYVLLEGGPPVEEGDDDPSGDGGSDQPGGDETTGGSDQSNGGDQNNNEGGPTGSDSKGNGNANSGNTSGSQEHSTKIGSEGNTGDKPMVELSGATVGETQDSSASEAESSSNANKSQSSSEQQNEQKSESPGEQGGFSIYQMMNDDKLKLDNQPMNSTSWKLVAIPVTTTAMVVGGIQSFIWYKRQAKDVVLFSTQSAQSAA